MFHVKKDIKDYAAFYLGCPMRMYNEVTEKWSNCRKLTISDLNLILNHGAKVELGLRPLSDMVEEEKEEWRKVGGYSKSATPYEQDELYVSLLSHDIGSPDVWNWLCKKGFDLFSLIESGIAINKSTLK